ncbi:hypothetical protein H0H92_015047 [Tricholoma furcatifolium]|nr:hypothetical protein H0H92_015047 [Tricholoma furcatifolium]
MERVERSFRKQVNVLSGTKSSIDQKLDEHTASSVQQRDPTISRLATNYNHLVETMIQLIKDRKAPSHAICPEKIVTKGLYALDVDDTIWQDAGLNKDDDPAAPPPTRACARASRQFWNMIGASKKKLDYSMNVAACVFGLRRNGKL